jgi:hypothetical protein
MTFRNIRYKVNFIFCSIGRAGITGTKPQAAPYVGGCSSLLSQPVTRSVFIGSGQSQSRHWSLRFPFPSKGSAKTKGAPHLGQVGRSAWPIRRFCRRSAGRQLKFAEMSTIVPRRVHRTTCVLSRRGLKNRNDPRGWLGPFPMRCRQGDLLRHRPYNAADAVLFLKMRDRSKHPP